jgi:hypothetical protein
LTRLKYNNIWFLFIHLLLKKLNFLSSLQSLIDRYYCFDSFLIFCGHVSNLCLRRVEAKKKNCLEQLPDTCCMSVLQVSDTNLNGVGKLIFLDTGLSYPTYVIGVSFKCRILTHIIHCDISNHRTVYVS